jgi:hypothetical protein
MTLETCTYTFFAKVAHFYLSGPLKAPLELLWFLLEHNDYYATSSKTVAFIDF